jgi:hypothetical protein
MPAFFLTQDFVKCRHGGTLKSIGDPFIKLAVRVYAWGSVESEVCRPRV